MNQDNSDSCYASAIELVSQIKSETLSPVNLVEQFFDRIDAYNGTINAFVHLRQSEALNEAQAAERAVVRGEELGPLHGLPIAIKDSGTPIADVPLTSGSVPLANNVPSEDAVIVDRLKDAGAIVLGTTNTPEICHKGTTDNLLHGTTVTPFDTTRISGGSSGGSAAAIAAGMAPLATGSDAAGSIRIPASACGVYGFLPSFGLVPFDIRPDAVEAHTPFTSLGPITRTVEDAALMLEVMAGWHPRDPFSVPDQNIDFRGAVDRGIDGLSIAYSPDLGVFPVDERVHAVVTDAIDAFDAAGATVDTVEINLGHSYEELHATLEICFLLLIATTPDKIAKTSDIDLLGEHRDELTHGFLNLVERGRDLSIVDLKKADMVRTDVFDAIQDFFERYDVLVTPTLSVPPFDVDELGPTEIDGQRVDPLFGWQLTWIFNLTGHPVASVPAGVTSDEGLPVGLQIVGQRFNDEAVLAASGAFEREHPWRDTYPPAGVR